MYGSGFLPGTVIKSLVPRPDEGQWNAVPERPQSCKEQVPERRGLAARDSNPLAVAGGVVLRVVLFLRPCANTWLCPCLNRKVSPKLALI